MAASSHRERCFWAARQPNPGTALLEKGSRAVSLVFEKSELREIWEDADALEPWKDAIDELFARLK